MKLWLKIIGVALQLYWRTEGRSNRLIHDPMAALVLIRGIRKALKNIRRHIGASCVRTYCAANDNQLRICVHDNGTITSENCVAGYGLANIRFRVLNLSGRVFIVKNNGAEMLFIIPLPLAL
ncbi:MAG: hypothetical protein RLZZ129_1060 [Verrucomicrobiota bacterium]